MGSKKQPQQSTPPRKKTPTFLLELPLVVQAGQAARVGGHLEVGRQFYNAVLSAGQQRLRRMRADPAQAGRPALSPGRTRRSGGLPFQPCGSSTAFPSMPFTSSRKRCGFRGWPSTWTRCWRKPWPHAPIVPSTACAWAKPTACASRAGAVVSAASRTSATIPGCALSSRRKTRDEGLGICCGTTSGSRR
jgi:hypothetical protein